MAISLDRRPRRDRGTGQEERRLTRHSYEGCFPRRPTEANGPANLPAALSKLKIASGSNQSLIQFVEDGITVAGLPVIVSDQVDANTKFWGIPHAHVVLVVRKGTRVERFPAS